MAPEKVKTSRDVIHIKTDSAQSFKVQCQIALQVIHIKRFFLAHDALSLR